MFLSGQLGFVSPGVLISGGIEAQTEQVLRNLEAVLKENGGALEDIVKTTIWLTEPSRFPAFNAAYSKFFAPGSFPARSTVVSGLLIEGALVEIDAIAIRR